MDDSTIVKGKKEQNLHSFQSSGQNPQFSIFKLTAVSEFRPNFFFFPFQGVENFCFTIPLLIPVLYSRESKNSENTFDVFLLTFYLGSSCMNEKLVLSMRKYSYK